MTLWEDDASRSAAQRTIVMFGVNRGGTTSVAGICQRLGLFIGDDLHGNLEDRDLFPHLPLEARIATVGKRNAAHDVWGWKFPHIIEKLPEVLPHVRNPRFILVTRDLTANALGMVRRRDRSPQQALQVAMRRTQRNLAFARKTKRPTLLISYEKILMSPDDAIADLAAFTGLPADAERIAHARDFIQPGRYQKPEGMLQDGIEGAAVTP